MQPKWICDDLFDIAARLKSMDDKYRITFNGETRRYELHHLGCKPTKQLDLPYDRLDARTLAYVHKTRVDNHKRLLQSIDAHNARLQAEQERTLVERAAVRLDAWMCANT